MKLNNIKKLEDCFDGSVIYKYTFDKKIDETMMKKLAEKGKLQYFPEFLKPFFKIVTIAGVQVKGIVGDDNIEVVFPSTGKEEKKKKFDRIFACP